MKRKQIIFIQTTIFLLFILSSCSRENKIWNHAKSNNDISSFEYYIANYPYGEYTDSAKILISNIRELQKEKPPVISKIITTPIAPWDDMECKEICLQISISAPQSKEYETDFKEKGFKIVKDYFELRGIKILPLNQNCKTKLLISLKMKSFGASYLNFGYLYTGYEIKGTYILTTDGYTSIKGAISKKEPVAQQVEKKNQFGGSTYRVKSTRIVGPEPTSPFPDINSLVLNNEFISKLWNTPNLSSPLPDTQLPEYYINYIYRLFCSQDYHDRGQAISIINSDYFDRKPEDIIPLITYNLNNYCLYDQNIKYGNLGFEILEKMSINAIEAAPILIELMAYRKKTSSENKYLDLKNNYIEEILETITRQKNDQMNDIGSWRTWWFNYKRQDLKD